MSSAKQPRAQNKNSLAQVNSPKTENTLRQYSRHGRLFFSFPFFKLGSRGGKRYKFQVKSNRMLEIFSPLMAHGYSGAGAVFQMPASATDVDVLCSRSATADLFHLFSLSLGFICFWCFGSACYPSIMLLIFILFVIVVFSLRFRLLFLSVSDQLFLTFFWSLFDFFPHLHLVFHLPNFLFFLPL